MGSATAGRSQLPAFVVQGCGMLMGLAHLLGCTRHSRGHGRVPPALQNIPCTAAHPVCCGAAGTGTPWDTQHSSSGKAVRSDRAERRNAGLRHPRPAEGGDDAGISQEKATEAGCLMLSPHQTRRECALLLRGLALPGQSPSRAPRQRDCLLSLTFNSCNAAFP